MDGSVVIGVSLDTASLEASIAQVQTQLSSLGASFGEAIGNPFENLDLSTPAAEMISVISNTLLSGAGEVSAAMSSMAAAALSGFASAGWNSGGQTAVSAISSGISSGSGGVISAVRSIASQAESIFSSGNWNSIGSSMMSGIASGILAAGQQVVAAIRRVSAEAEAAVKEYYKIQSPSALMRDEVGVMISRGIAEGIVGASGEVRRAMETVSRGAEFGLSPSQRIIGGGDARAALESAGMGMNSSRSGQSGDDGRREYVQNIYLRDSETSPYAVAKKIRRESEVLLSR